jgi:rhodanese-related sulfurtransferase
MNENFYLVTGIVSSIISLISFANYYTLTGIYLISNIEAKKKIKSGEIKVIIDVRTLIEFNLGHYPNALHLPYNKINKKSIKEINKNNGILVYCNTGQRARKAAEKLKSLGFKNVFYIASTYKTILDI